MQTFFDDMLPWSSLLEETMGTSSTMEEEPNFMDDDMCLLPGFNTSESSPALGGDISCALAEDLAPQNEPEDDFFAVLFGPPSENYSALDAVVDTLVLPLKRSRGDDAPYSPQPKRTHTSDEVPDLIQQFLEDEEEEEEMNVEGVEVEDMREAEEVEEDKEEPSMELPSEPTSETSADVPVCVRMYRRMRGNVKWAEASTAPPKIGKMRKISVTVGSSEISSMLTCRVVDISSGRHKSSCFVSARALRREEKLGHLDIPIPSSSEPTTVSCFLVPTWGPKTAHAPRFSVELCLQGSAGPVLLHRFEFGVAAHKYESGSKNKAFLLPEPVFSNVSFS